MRYWALRRRSLMTAACPFVRAAMVCRGSHVALIATAATTIGGRAVRDTAAAGSTVARAGGRMLGHQ